MAYKGRVRNAATVLDGGRVDEAALEARGGERALRQYHRRLHAVEDLERAQRGVGHGDKLAVARDVAARHEANWRTLLTWQRRFRAGGPDALVPQWGKTEGSNTIPKPLRAELLAMGLALIRKTQGPMYRYARRWCRAKGCVAPSRYAVSRFLDKHLRPRSAAEFRGGKRVRGQAHRAQAQEHDSQQVRVQPVRERRGPAAEEQAIPTLYERLKSIIGRAKGLPPDLARNHDHYLHGQPKR